VEGSCEHGNEPSGSIKFWKIRNCTAGGFTRRAQLRRVSKNIYFEAPQVPLSLRETRRNNRILVACVLMFTFLDSRRELRVSLI
jgi:hypothetical protein